MFQSNLDPNFSFKSALSWFISWFLLLYLPICSIKLLPSIFPNLQILFLHSWFKKNTNLNQRNFLLSPYTIKLILFSAHIFLLFYHLPYILNVKTCSTKSVSIFGFTVYVFRNLFWKYVVFWSNFNHGFEVLKGFFLAFLL